MTCIAIDPGNEESAMLIWNGSSIENAWYCLNDEIVSRLRTWGARPRISAIGRVPLVIEQIASYGMAVGETTFETVFWSGRFAEAYGMDAVHRIKRLEVKLHLCHDSRAKDGNIRQAILDRFGGKEKAIGRKASPGVFYGVSGDLWAALAVAITWHDKNSVGVLDRYLALAECSLESK